MSRFTRTGAVLATCLACLTWATQAWAATWTVQPTPNGGPLLNYLDGVTATGTGEAWAAGDYTLSSGKVRTLIEHYNGTKWGKQKSPNPSSDGDALYAVKASSTSSVWAVGEAGATNASKSLILHYDGSSWTRQTSPSPNSATNLLDGVSETSDTNAWAVGYQGVLPSGARGFASARMPSTRAETGPLAGSNTNTLIEHYDGTSWKVQKSVDPGASDNYLFASSSLSTTNSWAAGFYRMTPGGYGSTLVEHYDGTKWRRQTTPNPGGAFGDGLYGVSANSPTDVWAVGAYHKCADPTCERGLILHNDGTGWKVVFKLSSEYSGLYDVKATSATNAWAVGFSFTPDGVEQTLILHYDGASWTVQTTPDVGPFPNALFGVAGTSSSQAFTVGTFATDVDASTTKTLAMACC